MIEIDDTQAPEQVAADLVRAAFNAVGRIPARDAEDQRRLAAFQINLSQTFVDLTEIRSVY